MMNDMDKKFFGVLILLCFVLAFLLGILVMADYYQKQAVEHGAAYWCIVDHEKTFSWEECE